MAETKSAKTTMPESGKSSRKNTKGKKGTITPVGKSSHRKKCQDDALVYILSSVAPPVKEYYDYIVVGAGPAGSVLAKNLAQDDRGNSSTLLLESGVNNNNSPFVLNPVFPTVSVPSINMLNYADQPETSTTPVSRNATLTQPTLPLNGNSRIVFHVGRGLGGGSAKNFLNVVRGSPMYHQDLAENYTDSGWEDFVDIYNAVETYNAPDVPITRGDKGAIQVTPAVVGETPAAGSIDEGIINAAESLYGVSLSPDYNNLENSCTFFGNQRFLRPGPPVRSFAGNEYLGDTVMNQETGEGLGKWSKLRVKTSSTVNRVLFDRDHTVPRAIGVEVVGLNGQKHEYYARKEVILSAGSIYNPAILQRSGIGPAALLQSLDIGLVVDNPNVGKNLLSHYGNVTVIETSLEWTLPSGPATGGYFPIGPTGPTGDMRRRVQMQITGGINSLTGPAVPFMQLNPNEFPTQFSALMWLLRQTSRGVVEIVSKDPLTYPSFRANCYIVQPDPNNFATSTQTDDVDSVIQFWVTWRQIVENINAAHGSQVMRIVWPPQNELFAANKPNLLQYIASAVTMTDHPTGTCAMGKSDSTTRVVDDRLRVVGVERLRCADLSVLPIIPDGNTCMPAYFVGVKAAQFITGTTYNRDNVA